MRTLLPLLLLVTGCEIAGNDPDGTGVGVVPRPDTWEGPRKLAIVNRTRDTIHCEAWESPYCPSLGSAWDGIETLEAGDRWEIQDVDCVEVDVACFVDDFDDTTLPLRAWTWFVQPPTVFE